MAFLQPTTYTATTSFHPETSQGLSLNALGDPLSMILGGGGVRGDGETAQMMEVLQSRHLSELVASRPVPDSLGYAQSDSLILADLVMQHVPPRFSIRRFQQALKSLFRQADPPSRTQKVIAAGRYLRSNLSVEINDNGFLLMELPFYDPKALEWISRTYIQQLRSYYQQQKTEKADSNIYFFENRAAYITQKVDSVKGALAKLYDRSDFSVSSSRFIREEELKLQLEFYSTILKNLMVNLEQARSQRQKDVPVVQVLDQPRPPFKVQAPFPPLQGVLGFLLGALGMALFLSRRLLARDISHVIREALKDEPIAIAPEPGPDASRQVPEKTA